MEPTKEQQKLLTIVKDYEGDIKVEALAGVGKTTSLLMVTKDNPDKSFLYLAFNKSVEREASKKFPDNCA